MALAQFPKLASLICYANTEPLEPKSVSTTLDQHCGGLMPWASLFIRQNSRLFAALRQHQTQHWQAKSKQSRQWSHLRHPI